LDVPHLRRVAGIESPVNSVRLFKDAAHWPCGRWRCHQTVGRRAVILQAIGRSATLGNQATLVRGATTFGDEATFVRGAAMLGGGATADVDHGALQPFGECGLPCLVVGRRAGRGDSRSSGARMC
jgi:hypothetical protein